MADVRPPIDFPREALDHAPDDPTVWSEVPLELLVRFSCVPVRREGERIVLAFASLDDPTKVDELEFLLERPIEPVAGPVRARRDPAAPPPGRRGPARAGERGPAAADRLGTTRRPRSRRSSSPRRAPSCASWTRSSSAPSTAAPPTSTSRPRTARSSPSTGSTACSTPPSSPSTSATTTRSSAASRSCRSSTSPRSGCRRTAASACGCKGRTIDFRVSIMPSIHGEDAVIRILDKEQLHAAFRSLRLDVLGFAEADLRKLRKYITEPYGMVLVTGPTGSGKTTTLYAALCEIASPEDKIITIEDPVEYQIPAITQVPVNEKKGLTFARGLRSILRHDPDKIMVGEVRDAGDGPDRGAVGPHGPPRLHHRPRQQRLRRHRPLPPHGRRALQLRLGPQLHARPATGARALRRAAEDGAAARGAPPRVGPRPRALPRPGLLRAGGLRGVRRDRLPRTHGGGGAARHVGPHPPDDPRPPARRSRSSRRPARRA